MGKNKATNVTQCSLADFRAHNAISEIDEDALADYPELQHLDLSGNKINSVRNGSLNAPKLKNL